MIGACDADVTAARRAGFTGSHAWVIPIRASLRTEGRHPGPSTRGSAAIVVEAAHDRSDRGLVAIEAIGEGRWGEAVVLRVDPDDPSDVAAALDRVLHDDDLVAEARAVNPRIAHEAFDGERLATDLARAFGVLATE